MKLSATGVSLIKSRESCRLEAYLCPAGRWTIGYGHTGPEVHKTLSITRAEADAFLRADLIAFDSGVVQMCPAATSAQHDAMVSLAYNIGLGAFRKSSVARLHNAGKFAEAAQAFALWNKAGGKVLSGLVSRRAAEASLYLSDMKAEDSSTADGEKSLLASRTLNGQAIAAATVTTVASSSSAVSDSSWWSAIKADLIAWLPYLSHFQWLLLVLVGVGIGLTVYGRYQDRREGRC